MTEVIANQVDRRVFPVNIVREARDSSLTGRLFNGFRWGEYLQYAWPEQKVFVDGTTDDYGGTIMQAHGSVLALTPGWRDSLSTWTIDLILLPPQEPIVSELLQARTWGVWQSDQTAVPLRPDGSENLGDQSVLDACRVRGGR